MVIERVIPFDLQGAVTLNYHPEGLQAQFAIPACHVILKEDSPNAPIERPAAVPLSATSTPDRPLHGLRLLVLEDNLIVALEAEDLLRALGARSVCTASTVAAAKAMLETGPIDLAVLDIDLGPDTSWEFASYLDEAKIPYVFSSGYGEDCVRDRGHHDALLVAKPYDSDRLGSALLTALNRGNPRATLVSAHGL